MKVEVLREAPPVTKVIVELTAFEAQQFEALFDGLYREMGGGAYVESIRHGVSRAAIGGWARAFGEAFKR